MLTTLSRPLRFVELLCQTFFCIFAISLNSMRSGAVCGKRSIWPRLADCFVPDFSRSSLQVNGYLVFEASRHKISGLALLIASFQTSGKHLSR